MLVNIRYNIIVNHQSSTLKVSAQCVAHIQIFLQVQVGQVNLCPPSALGAQVGLTDPTVQAVPFDLVDPSVPGPLLTLSGKIPPQLAIHTVVK